jgi:serine/threonine protein phosphatase PrpC
MGASITAAIWRHDNVMYITGLGNCRAYLMRGERLEQLTTDDTLVRKLYDEGILSWEVMQTHPHRGDLCSYLGRRDVKLDRGARAVPLAAGDRFLLCSDGLWLRVPDAKLKLHLRCREGPESCAKSLTQLAVAADNRADPSAIVIDAKNELPEVQADTSRALPSPILHLADAFAAGEPCHFALHDALLDAGHPQLAEHFRTAEHLPDCWALQKIRGN